MNSIVKALKEMEISAGASNRWNLETLCKMAALEIETKAASIIDLTLARGEDEKRIATLENDAKLNDMAWNENQAALNKQAEEIRTLKQELETIKACKHMHVKIHSRLFRPSTLEEPAEFEYKAECKDCGELFSADDVDEWAEVEE